MRTRFAGALVDMDGTLYRGDDPIPGARAAIETLREAGIAVQFLTDNTPTSFYSYSVRYKLYGIP